MFSRQSPARQRAALSLCRAGRARGSPAPARPRLRAAHGRRSARGACPSLAGECASGERSERRSREKERSTYRQRSSPAAELPPARPAQPGSPCPARRGAG